MPLYLNSNCPAASSLAFMSVLEDRCGRTSQTVKEGTGMLQSTFSLGLIVGVTIETNTYAKKQNLAIKMMTVGHRRDVTNRPNEGGGKKLKLNLKINKSRYAMPPHATERRTVASW